MHCVTPRRSIFVSLPSKTLKDLILHFPPFFTPTQGVYQSLPLVSLRRPTSAVPATFFRHAVETPARPTSSIDSPSVRGLYNFSEIQTKEEVDASADTGEDHSIEDDYSSSDSGDEGVSKKKKTVDKKDAKRPKGKDRRTKRDESEEVESTRAANAASGMAVNDECKLKFLELKSKRTHRFIVFKIEEKLKQVVVEKLGGPSQSYEDFAASLPADECRYAVYDFDFVTEENCQKSRIFFIAWSPDNSRVRSKMIYASSKDRFKRELDGIQVELQATDPTEMGLDVIRSRAN